MWTTCPGARRPPRVRDEVDEHRLSSTAARVADASVSGDLARLSPASTDAKTTDENLFSDRENDKNYKLVDSGDIPRPASAPAPAPSSDGRHGMKFRVERDALADAVSWAARSLASRPTLPVLAGLLLQVSGDELSISGFDLEASTQVELEVTVRRRRQRAGLGPAAGRHHPLAAAAPGRRHRSRAPGCRSPVVPRASACPACRSRTTRSCRRCRPPRAPSAAPSSPPRSPRSRWPPAATTRCRCSPASGSRSTASASPWPPPTATASPSAN